MVEVKVSRRKVWKKEGEKGDFTEWPKRRMFSRQREAYLSLLLLPRDSCCQGLETPVSRSSAPIKWHKTQEQLTEDKWQCRWKAVPLCLRLLGSGREKEKQMVPFVQPFSGPASFQAISTPFWLPCIFRHLVPGRGKKNKEEERPSQQVKWGVCSAMLCFFRFLRACWCLSSVHRLSAVASCFLNDRTGATTVQGCYWLQWEEEDVGQY